MDTTCPVPLNVEQIYQIRTITPAGKSRVHPTLDRRDFDLVFRRGHELSSFYALSRLRNVTRKQWIATNHGTYYITQEENSTQFKNNRKDSSISFRIASCLYLRYRQRCRIKITRYLTIHQSNRKIHLEVLQLFLLPRSVAEPWKFGA